MHCALLQVIMWGARFCLRLFNPVETTVVIAVVLLLFLFIYCSTALPSAVRVHPALFSVKGSQRRSDRFVKRPTGVIWRGVEERRKSPEVWVFLHTTVEPVIIVGE